MSREVGERLTEYLQLPRTRRGDYGWGRVVAALVLLTVGCAAIVGGVGTALALASTADGSPPPVVGILQVGVIGLWVAIVWLVACTLFGMRFGDLVSWRSRVRWRLLGISTAISVLGLGAYTLALAAINGSSLVPLTGAIWLAVLVALILVPIQAAAEELLFRAFVPQIILAKTGVNAVKYGVVAVISSVVFASLHGAGSIGGLIMFALFGVVFATLVYFTAGVEAAIALHAVNNLLVIVGGMLTGREAKPGEVDNALSPATFAQLGVMIAIAVVIAFIERRRTGTPR